MTREQKPGKVVSSLVVYTKSAIEMAKLRMRRKLFHRTSYDWDRGRKDKR